VVVAKQSLTPEMPVAKTDFPTSLVEGVKEFSESIARLMADDDLGNMEDVEVRIGEALNSVGRALMKARLQSLDPGGRDLDIDGTRYWQAVRGEREYMTAFGPISVERGLYRAVRNGPTVCPMERRAGILGQFWTRRAAKVAISAVVDMTPYRASEFFAELRGMQPSRSSLERLPKELSRRWERDREKFERAVREADTIPTEAVSAAVSIDGVMLPMRDGDKSKKKARTRAEGRADKGPAGYREAGCASLSYYDADGERLKTIRLGRMPEFKMVTLREMLRSELEHVRTLRPDLKVIAIADGKPDLWEFLGELGADMEVVDFYHAAEHLKRAIDVSDGASIVATQKRFQKLRRWLKYKALGVQTVIRSLAQRRPRRQGDHAEYRRGVGYFRRHAHRMNYPRLRRHHLPIGSGVVEGTCRWLVSDRMKRTGMRWDAVGGQAILTLRALVHSGRFHSAWPLLVGDQPPCSPPPTGSE
jgi:hypothetical protein